MSKSVFLDGVNKKSERAWKELYRHYYASLCSYADYLTGDKGIGEDVVQDCLIRMWKTEVEFDDVRKLTAWLYKSVYNASISVLREKRLQKRLYDNMIQETVVSEDDAKYMALREEMIGLFYNVLHMLPKQQQEVLQYSLKGLSVSEVAKTMGISENTVKTLKKRAYLVCTCTSRKSLSASFIFSFCPISHTVCRLLAFICELNKIKRWNGMILRKKPMKEQCAWLMKFWKMGIVLQMRM